MPGTRRYFDLLAPELIQLIFLYVVESEKRDGHFVEYRPNRAPMVLLEVCKRWQLIAFRTPGIFDSMSLRRRVRAPKGFDFNFDSWILSTFLYFPRSTHRLRPLSLQLCYGDIRDYGNYLMWNDLLRMVRVISERAENLERLYLRFPDDCMEKFLMKLCSEAKGSIKHESLRSLTLHSTREKILQRRYIAWWYDQEVNAMPAYYHKLDLSDLPALEELGLHFPGPLTLDPVCYTVRRLHVSIFKWEQLEEYLESCPKTEELIINLREALVEQQWNLEGVTQRADFPRIRRLEIRSALKGRVCADHLLRLFTGLRIPNLKSLRLRRHPQSDGEVPPVLGHGALIMSILMNLEELELIDFPPEAIGEWNIGALFAAARRLKRFAYREDAMTSSLEYFSRLISDLTFFGTELRAPKLEVLELESDHLRQGANETAQAVLQLIASRRYPMFFVNTGNKRRPKEPQLPCLLRKVLLPRGCSDVLREMDIQFACFGVEFDCVPTLERLEREDDLDQEGDPRDPVHGANWQPLTWRIVLESDKSFDSSTPGSSFVSEPTSRSRSEPVTPEPPEPVEDFEQKLTEDAYSSGEIQLSRHTSYDSKGLNRLDSIAEVELML